MKIKLDMHSFSTRVSLYVLLITGTVFSLAFVIFYHSARSQVQAEAEKYAMSSLENTVLRIDKILHSVEVAVANNAWQSYRYVDQPDSWGIMARGGVDCNPAISGGASACVPDV